MLPEALSTGATLAARGRRQALPRHRDDRRAPMACAKDGDVYRAIARNKAQLAYGAVGAWLEARGPAPPKVAASSELQGQLKLQSEVAQALRRERFRHGALDIETIESRPVILNEQVIDLAREDTNDATELIEDFMIASNGAVARLLEARRVSSIRRIVRTPKRWDRIVELASTLGTRLPATPDSKALNQFLAARRAADPDHFPDLSLSVIKLMGPGEYVLERPGDPDTGHFGLAVQDYTHSTAPNRRYADLVTQRLIKAVLAGQPGAVFRRRAVPHRRDVHGQGRRGAESRARDVEAHRGGRDEPPDRRRVRRDRDRRHAARHVRADPPAARRRPACARAIRAWTSATGCACGSSTRTSSEVSSISRARSAHLSRPLRTGELGPHERPAGKSGASRLDEERRLTRENPHVRVGWLLAHDRRDDALRARRCPSSRDSPSRCE